MKLKNIDSLRLYGILSLAGIIILAAFVYILIFAKEKLPPPVLNSATGVIERISADVLYVNAQIPRLENNILRHDQKVSTTFTVTIDENAKVVDSTNMESPRRPIILAELKAGDTVYVSSKKGLLAQDARADFVERMPANAPPLE